MPTIDSFRFANLNFDSDKAHIQDMTIEVGSKESLWLIRNGGGKSVISQICMQPYVFGHDRNTNKRPFKDYLPFSKPLYMLHQYKLDDDAGYLIVGFLAIRVKSDDENTNSEESSGNDQVIITNILRKFPSRISLNSIPLFYRSDNDVIKLRNYDYMVKYFADSGYGVYPIGNSDKKKEYIRELANYKIDTTEWKEIIREANLDESGLSKFFEKDSKASDIVRRIFLPKIQVKLSEHELKIEDIEKSIYNYFIAVENNEENLSNQQVYREFMVESELLGKEIENYISLLDKKHEAEENLSHYNSHVKSHKELLEKEIAILEDELKEVDNLRTSLNYEKASLEYHTKHQEFMKVDEECAQYESHYKETSLSVEKLAKELDLLKCAEIYTKIMEADKQLDIAKTARTALENGEDVDKINRYKFTLKNKYADLLDAYESESTNMKKETKLLIEERNLLTNDIKCHETNRATLDEELKSAEKTIKKFSEECNKFSASYVDFKPKETFSGFEKEYFTSYEVNLKRKTENLNKEIEKVEISNRKLQLLVNQVSEEVKDKNEEKTSNQLDCESLLRNNDQFIKDKNEMLDLLHKYGLNASILYDRNAIMDTIEQEESTLMRSLETVFKKTHEINQEIMKLQSNTVLTLPDSFKEKLNELGIEYTSGFEWLKDNPNLDESEKISMIVKNELLPYALIFDNVEDIKTVLGLDIYLSFPLPLMVLKNIFNDSEQLSHVQFYSKFNAELFNEDKLAAKIIELEQCLSVLNGEYGSIKHSISEINKHKTVVYKFEYDMLYEKNIALEITNMQNKISMIKEEIDTLNSQIKNYKTEMEQRELELKKIQDDITKSIRQEEAYKHIFGILDDYYNGLEAKKRLKNDIEIEGFMIKELDEKYISLQTRIDELNKRIPQVESMLKSTNALYEKVSDAEKTEEIDSDKEVSIIQGIYNHLTQNIDGELKVISNKIIEYNTQKEEEQKKLQKYIEKNRVTDDYKSIEYSPDILSDIEEKLKDLRIEQIRVLESSGNLRQSRGILITNVINIEDSIDSRFKLEPMPMNEITINRDFDKDIKDCDSLYKSIKDERDEKIEMHTVYRDEYTATEHYSKDIKTINTIVLSINNQNLKEFRLNLLNSHRKLAEDVQDTKNKLYNFKIKMFCEDFIAKKTVFEDVLFEFTDHTIDPRLLYGKLQERRLVIKTLLDNIDTSLSELKNDESIIIEHLYNYIKRLYAELGEIDKGSYITIDGEGKRKMLHIAIKNDINYLSKEMVRLQILSETVSGAKIKRSEGKDVSEYIKSFMKADNLFDRTYGIDNIDIKLYKLTERGASIQSFEETKTNSGGEGSFTAFVILSCVMTYFRKNSIGTKDNWKLMLLDNPFAKMTSPHLLVPLFDLAKKLQVQLICLSDIDTEGVKDRFDDIHVFMHVPVEGKEKETLLIDVSDLESHQQLQDNSFAYKYENVDQITMLVQ